MLAEVPKDKLEIFLAKKCSEKDVLVSNSGKRNFRFKIYKSKMFIPMCQFTGSSYVQPKQN